MLYYIINNTQIWTEKIHSFKKYKYLPVEAKCFMELW